MNFYRSLSLTAAAVLGVIIAAGLKETNMFAQKNPALFMFIYSLFAINTFVAAFDRAGKKESLQTFSKNKKRFAPKSLTPGVIRDILRADVDFVHLRQETIDSSPDEVKTLRNAGIDIRLIQPSEIEG